ncbi:hypothetical protein Bpfe_025938 [Biomphalaria pfeifferi]|uniref:Uncharacterized protein n=1 Tax=Biomphalaria pfeifferi TaxID=112525 RepID=A0AAD8AYC7_BIOPF|nr:hypothetical protein Bpfe_025938 [Biomphalaria pfeifferi]
MCLGGANGATVTSLALKVGLLNSHEPISLNEVSCYDKPRRYSENAYVRISKRNPIGPAETDSLNTLHTETSSGKASDSAV